MSLLQVLLTACIWITNELSIYSFPTCIKAGAFDTIPIIVLKPALKEKLRLCIKSITQKNPYFEKFGYINLVVKRYNTDSIDLQVSPSFIFYYPQEKSPIKYNGFSILDTKIIVIKHCGVNNITSMEAKLKFSKLLNNTLEQQPALPQLGLDGKIFERIPNDQYYHGPSCKITIAREQMPCSN